MRGRTHDLQPGPATGIHLDPASVEEDAGLRWRIIELERSLKEARRQVIVAEFVAHIDKTQIKQLQALLECHERKPNVKAIV